MVYLGAIIIMGIAFAIFINEYERRMEFAGMGN